MGQGLRGRGSRSLREPVPGRPSPTPNQPCQGARLPARAAPRKTVTTPGPKNKSQARAYGDAGGEGLFSSYRISESLTHPACGIPPHLQAGEGCCQLIFRRQTKMYKLRVGGETPCLSERVTRFFITLVRSHARGENLDWRSKTRASEAQIWGKQSQ